MKKLKTIDIFGATNSLKVLSYLAENLGKEFLGGQVQKATSISRAGLYIALGELARQNLISKEGKEFNQGIAYLDDGTMVVVDNSKHMIGQVTKVIVTSVLQTSAGRMIFAKLEDANKSGGRQGR